MKHINYCKLTLLLSKINLKKKQYNLGFKLIILNVKYTQVKAVIPITLGISILTLIQSRKRFLL